VARASHPYPRHKVNAMQHNRFPTGIAILVFAVISSLQVSTAQAQTAASTANATITPRTADGHPDFSGVWETDFWLRPQQLGASICLVGCEEMPQAPPAADAAATEHPPLDRPMYRPEYVGKVHDLNARQVEEDPVLRCENPGLPRIGPPDKVVQISDQLVFLYDDVNGSFYRTVPTDGRGHRTDVEASFLGDSVGHWEGETLVVESVNFNDETWLTDDGSFHTAGLRVIERLTRSGDTLRWQATAHDPAVLAEPWKMQPRTATLSDIEIAEPARCIDRDLPLMQDGTSHDNPR
jgi:hypothetical protein